MRIGVPRETKDGERRVGVTPAGTRQLVDDGHTMIVAPNAGAAVGFADADYRAAGATIAASLDAVWSCDLIVKVKELQPHEYAHLVAGTTVFGFAQINRDPALLAALDSRIGVIGYETVRDAQGGVPLLAPMRSQPIAVGRACCCAAWTTCPGASRGDRRGLRCPRSSSRALWSQRCARARLSWTWVSTRAESRRHRA